MTAFVYPEIGLGDHVAFVGVDEFGEKLGGGGTFECRGG